jgi:hypothetical protein
MQVVERRVAGVGRESRAFHARSDRTDDGHETIPGTEREVDEAELDGNGRVIIQD